METISVEKPKIGDGIYTSSEVAEILNISKRRATYLIKAYSEQKFKDLSNFTYVYKNERRKSINFYGLIELKVFDTLRSNGFSSYQILDAYKEFAKEYGTNYPFAKKQVLFMGKKIILQIGGGYRLVSGEKTLLIPKIIESFAKKIEFSEDGTALRLFPIGMNKDVVVDPNHQFGAPTVKDTNIRASTLCGMHEAGDSIKLLSALYKIEEKSVKDAIAYCHRKAS